MGQSEEGSRGIRALLLAGIVGVIAAVPLISRFVERKRPIDLMPPERPRAEEPKLGTAVQWEQAPVDHAGVKDVIPWGEDGAMQPAPDGTKKTKYYAGPTFYTLPDGRLIEKDVDYKWFERVVVTAGGRRKEIQIPIKPKKAAAKKKKKKRVKR